MPPLDASPAEPHPSHAAGQSASGAPQRPGDTAQPWLPASVQWGWQAPLHELRLYLETRAREVALEQAHDYCTGLAGWAMRGFFGRMEHLYLPPRIKLLMTTATLHQSQEFCGALVAQLHVQGQALLAGVQQVFQGQTPPPQAAAMESAVATRPAPAGAAAAPSEEPREPAADLPPSVEVDLVGGWSASAGAPLL